MEDDIAMDVEMFVDDPTRHAPNPHRRQDFSGTVVQEQGDEADFVKTDGHHITTSTGKTARHCGARVR